MNNKLFIGNLSWSITDQALSDMFKEYGEVLSARVVRDQSTNKSRGFAFVELADEKSAQAAIDALNETTIDDRSITVSIAKAKTDE